MANERGWYSACYAAILDSPEYERLSLDATAVWWALKFCPENNQLGIFPFFREQVAARSKVPLERVQDALRELEREKWILMDGRFVWIRNHLKFDPNFLPENDNQVKGLVKKLGSLPNIPLSAKFIKYYKSLGYLPKGLPQGLRSPSPSPSQAHPEGSFEEVGRASNPDTEPIPIPNPNTETEPSARYVFDHWSRVMDKPDAKFTADRRAKVETRLREGFTVAALCEAIDGCRSSEFHMGANDKGIRYNDLELICRNGSKVEQFRAMLDRAPPTLPKAASVGDRTVEAMRAFVGGQGDNQSGVLGGARQIGRGGEADVGRPDVDRLPRSAGGRG